MEKATKYTWIACAGMAMAGLGYAIMLRNADHPSPLSSAPAQSQAQTPEHDKAAPSARDAAKARARRSESYSGTDNLNAYIARLNTQVTAPGAIELAQAKAWDECGVLTIDPSSFDKQMADLRRSAHWQASFQITALRHFEARCRDFAMSTHLNQASAAALYGQAAAAGNPEAHARAVAMGISVMPAKEAQGAIMDIINSGSPEAIFSMASAMGDQGPYEITPGDEVGGTSSVYAWQLVACDHGLDCSSTSNIVQQSCLYLGMCGPGDYRANIQYSAVSPAQYQQITEIEARLNTAIANGTVGSYLTHK